MEPSLPPSNWEPRLDASGCPLIVPDEDASSAPFVQAVFDEDIEAVTRILDAQPELADSVVHHHGRSYSRWHLNHWKRIKYGEDYTLGRCAFPLVTEPAVLFACRVPEFKITFRYKRKISRKSVEIVRLLVDRGGTINPRHPTGTWIDAAFGIVCGLYDEPEVLRLLVRAGANPFSKWGCMSSGPPMSNVGGRSTPLGVAAACGAIGTVKLLLEYGVPYNDFNRHSDLLNLPPLHQAAQFGRADVVAALLEHGAASDLELRPPLSTDDSDEGPFGSVPLVLAVFRSDSWAEEDSCKAHMAWLRDDDLKSRERTVHLLLDRGASPTTRNSSQLPLLYGACSWAGREVISRLITYNREGINETFSSNMQDPNIFRPEFSSTNDGATYLHVAAGHANTPAMQCLIDSGLRPIADGNDRSPLHWLAIQAKSHSSTVEEIRLNGNPDFPDPIVAAARYLCESVGINVHTQDRFGRTALHYAFRANAYELAIFLLSRGASLAAQDHDGCTPLHYLVQFEWGLKHYLVGVTEALNQMPSTAINARDSNGDTALTLACAAVNYSAVQLILAIGGDANLCDSRSWTPLHRLAQRPGWREWRADVHRRLNGGKEVDEPSRVRSALVDAGAVESTRNDEGYIAAEIDAMETRRELERRAEAEERRMGVEELRRLGYGRGALREYNLRRMKASSGPEGQAAGHGRGGPCKMVPS